MRAALLLPLLLATPLQAAAGPEEPAAAGWARIDCFGRYAAVGASAGSVPWTLLVWADGWGDAPPTFAVVEGEGPAFTAHSVETGLADGGPEALVPWRWHRLDLYAGTRLVAHAECF